MTDTPPVATVDVATHQAERVAWIDYAKGFCIVMVVLLHAHYEIVDLFGDSGWVAPIVAFAKPFRMPDFFLIAGLFLARVIDRPWREYLDRKVWHFLYFYLLWIAIHFVLFGIKTALNNSGGDWHAVLSAYLLTFIEPSGSLWFIHSLAVYFLVVRLLRNVPWYLVWLVSAGLQMLNVQTGWTVIDQFCLRFVYFYSGYLFASRIFALAQWSAQRQRIALLLLGTWAVGNQWLVSRGWWQLPGVGLLLGYAGAVAVVLFAVALSGANTLSVLRYFGQNSIVLFLSDYLVQRVALKAGLTKLPVDHGTLTVLLTLISIAGGLLLFQLATRCNVTFMYRRPTWSHLRGRA